MSTTAARSTVQVAAYVPPEQAREFDLAATVAGLNRSEALRVAMRDFAEAVTDLSIRDDARLDPGGVETPTDDQEGRPGRGPE